MPPEATYEESIREALNVCADLRPASLPVLCKADLAVKIARYMLRDVPDATIEEQAVVLMRLPDQAVLTVYRSLEQGAT